MLLIQSKLSGIICIILSTYSALPIESAVCTHWTQAAQPMGVALAYSPRNTQNGNTMNMINYAIHIWQISHFCLRAHCTSVAYHLKMQVKAARALATTHVSRDVSRVEVSTSQAGAVRVRLHTRARRLVPPPPPAVHCAVGALEHTRPVSAPTRCDLSHVQLLAYGVWRRVEGRKVKDRESGGGIAGKPSLRAKNSEMTPSVI